MQIIEAIGHIHRGDAVLFLGAGFSREALAVGGQPVPSSSELIRRLASVSGKTTAFDAVTDLDYAAELAMSLTSREEVFRQLEAWLQVAEPSSAQSSICALPWRRIYTTNFDDLVEVCAPRRPSYSFVDEVDDVVEGATIHLNGQIASSNAANYTHRLRLTTQSYLAIRNDSNAWFHQLQDDIASAAAVFVVGYSMYDDDIRKLFYSDPTNYIHDKTFFCCGTMSGPILQRAEYLGWDTGLTTADLATTVEQTPLGNDAEQALLPVGVERHPNTANSKDVTLTEITELFLYGNASDDLIASQFRLKSGPYVVEREAVRQEATGAQRALFHSHLGNGKTLALAIVAATLVPTRAVYWVSSSAPLQPVLDFMSKAPENTTFIVDGASVRSVEDYLFAATPAQVLVSIRTTSFEIMRSQIFARAQERPIRLIDVNTLSTSDIEQICSIVEKYALWIGAEFHGNRARQVQFIRDECEGEFSQILLWLFESPQIAEKLRLLIDEFMQLPEVEKQFLFVEAFLRIIDFGGGPMIAMRLVDYHPRQTDIKKNFIFTRRAGLYIVRSSVLAQYIFSKVNKRDVSKYIYSMAKSCDIQRYSWKIAQSIFRRVIRYRNIAKFVTEKTEIRDLFERLQTLEIARSDPLFWIQFSISRIDSLDFVRSRSFIDRARSIVAERLRRGNQFDPYQIDTHEAQHFLHLVKNGIATRPYSEAIRDAVGLLRGVLTRRPSDTRHVSQTTDLLVDAVQQRWLSFSTGDLLYIRAGLIDFADALAKVEKLVGADQWIKRAESNVEFLRKRIADQTGA